MKWSRCANISNYRWISKVQIIHLASCEVVLQLISFLSYSDSFPLLILQVAKISQVEFHNLRNCWMVDFLCAFVPCILVWLWQRVMMLQSLVFFMNLSFNLLCHKLNKDLPHSWIALVIKKSIKNTKT